MTTEKISPKVIRAVIATGMLSFCGVIVETATNITFPTLMNEFHIQTATVQWMTTIYLLVVASVIPLSAYLKRSFRTKSIFLTAILLFTLGVLIDAIAPSFGLLLVGRVIQGIGVGIALPLMFNIILEQVPASKIGVMMGIGTLITAVAPAIGPTFGGAVSSTLGWRFIFIILFPFLIVSFLLGISSIEQKSPVQRENLDLISFCSILLLFIDLILGMNNLADYPFFSLAVLGCLVLGSIGLVILITRSARLTQPIINLSLLKNKHLIGHVIAFFLFQIGALGMSFLLPNYIQLVNESNATMAGVLTLPGALIGACFAPFGGTILDRIGARMPIITGASIIIFANILFSIFGRSLSNSLVLLFYLIFMIGTGLAFGNIMTNGQKQVMEKERADVNAIFNTLQQFAGAFGTTLVSLIVAKSQANTTMSYAAATAKGSQLAFIVLFVTSILQFVILWKTVQKNK